MTHLGGKYWDLFVYNTALWSVVDPILAAAFESHDATGAPHPIPADLPGYITEPGPHQNDWRYRDLDIPGDRARTPLENVRLRALCDHIASVLIHCDVWDFDPADESPAVLRADLADALARRLRGSHDRSQTFPDWPITEPHLAPLVDGVHPDPFSAPVDLDVLARALADAVADAIESGTVEVSADEPYDSCSGCGGYHNVNWDCR